MVSRSYAEIRAGLEVLSDEELRQRKESIRKGVEARDGLFGAGLGVSLGAGATSDPWLMLSATALTVCSYFYAHSGSREQECRIYEASTNILKERAERQVAPA